MKDGDLTGPELIELLSSLANPYRLRIVAALANGQQYVSQLARDIGMSRPLLHMHLQRLEAANVVAGHLELSADGKAMKFFELVPFRLVLTSELIALAAASLPAPGSETPPTGDQ